MKNEVGKGSIHCNSRFLSVEEKKLTNYWTRTYINDISNLLVGGLDGNNKGGQSLGILTAIACCGLLIEVDGIGVKEANPILEREHNRGDEQGNAVRDHYHALQLPSNGKAAKREQCSLPSYHLKS